MDTERLLHLARASGLVEDKDLAKAKAERARLSASGEDASLWDALCRLKVIDPARIEALKQRNRAPELEQVRLDPYVLDERLGSGGMGDVYLGSGPDGKQVAVKVLPHRHRLDPEHVARFKREGQLHALIKHPHVAELYAHGEHHKVPWMALELVRGPNLRDFIRENGALSESQGLCLLEQMSGALLAIEQAGMVHRDIKPGNILIDTSHGSETKRAKMGNVPFIAKLIDFGLARRCGAAGLTIPEDPELTQPGTALGTPHYMSPEQALGESDVDFRSDMYSLGATLFHALMGRTLYSGRTSAIIMYKQATEHIDIQPLIDKGLDPLFAAMLRKMLAKDRDDRFVSWREILTECGRLRSESNLRPASVDISSSELARTASQQKKNTHPALQTSRLSRSVVERHLKLMIMVGVLIALLLAGVILWLLSSSRSQVLRASPADLAERLTELGHRTENTTKYLRLLPGRYTSEVLLGPSHSHLQLDMGLPEVVLAGAAQPFEIRLADGCQEVVLSGISDVPRGLKVHLGRGTSLRIVDCQIPGRRLSIVGHDAQLHLENVRSMLSVEVNGGTCTLEHCVVSSLGRMMQTSGSRVEILTSRLNCGGTGTAMTCAAGTLRFEGVLMEAAGYDVALETLQGVFADLRLSRIQGPKIAWKANDASLAVLSDLELIGKEKSLDWSGERSATWLWKSLRLEPKVAGLETTASAPLLPRLSELLPPLTTPKDR